jgi:hypothetical protein
MLALTSTQAVLANRGGHEIVLAIVGGTMLTLALTRPRLRWVESLTEDSAKWRLWSERGLTGFAFVMGGYAWATLFLTLQRQLGSQSAALLKGAAAFLIIYAWLTHFEPFLAEWRLSGGLAAAVLYTGFAILAAGIGVTCAEVVRTSLFTVGDIQLILTSGAAAFLCFGIFKLLPILESGVDRLLGEPDS